MRKHMFNAIMCLAALCITLLVIGTFVIELVVAHIWAGHHTGVYTDYKDDIYRWEPEDLHLG